MIAKMKATIKQEGEHYYALIMGDRIMGGTNRQTLERFARKQGYGEIEYTPIPPKNNIVLNFLQGW